MWSGKNPKLSHLRIFDSIVLVKTPGALGKLEDRSNDMVFVGYKRGTKGYRCFNPSTHMVHLSHDFILKRWCKWKFGKDNRGKVCLLKSFVFQVFILDLRM